MSIINAKDECHKKEVAIILIFVAVLDLYVGFCGAKFELAGILKLAPIEKQVILYEFQ